MELSFQLFEKVGFEVFTIFLEIRNKFIFWKLCSCNLTENKYPNNHSWFFIMKKFSYSWLQLPLFFLEKILRSQKYIMKKSPFLKIGVKKQDFHLSGNNPTLNELEKIERKGSETDSTHPFTMPSGTGPLFKFKDSMSSYISLKRIFISPFLLQSQNG